MLAIMDINPDTISSNGILAVRDAKKHKDLYEVLEISVDNNVEYRKYGKEKNNPYLSQVIYADMKNIIGDYLRDLKENTRMLRRLTALTLDEMDSQLIDGTGRMVQLAEYIQRLEKLEPLLIYIWGAVNAAVSILRVRDGVFSVINGINLTKKEQEQFDTDPNSMHNIIKEGEQYFNNTVIGNTFSSVLKLINTTVAERTLTEYFALDRLPENRTYVIPEDKLQFAKDQLSNWIQAAVITQLTYRKDIQYVIDKDDSSKRKSNKIVLIDSESGEHHPDMRISDGIHQFLQIANSLSLETESLNTDAMAYQTYIGLYRFIFGYTATPGNEENYKFFAQRFNISTFIMPNLVHKDLYRHTSFVADNVEEWKRQAFAHIYINCLSRNRAGLIILDTIEQAKDFYKFLTDRGVSDKYTYGVSGHDPREFNIQNKLKPRELVIGTPLASRGADFLLTPEVIANGGLFVLRKLPADERLREQMDGRAARNGQPGSVMASAVREELGVNGITYDDIVAELNKRKNHELIRVRQRELPCIIAKDKMFFCSCFFFKRFKFTNKLSFVGRKAR